MKIDSLRREYKLSALSRKNMDKNPVLQFEKWFKEAMNSGIEDANAMSLVTFGTDGFPQSRIVLLKYFGETGFTFFTDYNSEKGKAIKKNNAVGLHFYWQKMERQVRISGYAEKTDSATSDKYFYSRPVLSQISAVVSHQSHVIESREILEKEFEKIQKQLDTEKPKRPETWGGYVVKPVKIEFWQGRETRLHDRIRYEKENNIWIMKRLAP